MPYVRSSRPEIDRTTPAGSRRPACGFLLSGTSMTIAMTPTMTIGTLMRKTEPHQKCSMRNPPRTGPMATAAPTAAAHRPMALPRSRGGKTTVMIESVTGSTDAPAAPMTPRKRMSCRGVCAYAVSSDARPKKLRPMIEDALAAVLVAQHAPGEEQRGEQAGVGVDRPDQLLLRGVQLARDRRQRDVEHRVVEHDDEQADDQDAEDGPALRVEVLVDAARGRRRS